MLNYFCSKNVSGRQHGELTGETQVYHKCGSGGKTPSSWAIFVIFQKKLPF